MTKISVFGETEKENKELKKIRFNQFSICKDDGWKEGGASPQSWDEITLLKKDYHSIGVDLMLASDYNINETVRTLYLGQWNDGVV